MKEKAPILESFYADYFSDTPTDDIYLLSAWASGDIWTKYIDQKAGSFFRLPENNWLLGEQVIVGKWLNDYNAEEVENVHDLLSTAVTWEDKDTVFFCINKDAIIEVTWQSFKKRWIHFLQCENDAPVVINTLHPRCAILFRRSDIVKIGRCEPGA